MLQILTHPAVSGLLVMTIVGALAYKLNFVDISGLISAFVVGFTIWYTGGVVSFVIILFFFMSAGLATKVKYKEKVKQNLAQEGKGKRSWLNVCASPAKLVPRFIIRSATAWNWYVKLAANGSWTQKSEAS